MGVSFLRFYGDAMKTGRAAGQRAERPAGPVRRRWRSVRTG